MLDYNYHGIPQNEWNKKTVSDALSDSSRICLKLYKFMAEYLSNFHGKRISPNEVELLLGDWTNLYVQVLIDRSKSINNLSIMPDWIENFDELIQPPFCAKEFGEGISLSDDYNKQIYSLIYLLNKNNKLKKKLSKKTFDLTYQNKVSIKNKIISFLFKNISKTNRVFAYDLYINNFYERLKFAWINRELIRLDNFMYDFKINYRISMDKRFSCLDNSNCDEEIRNFTELLPYYMPSAFLECFDYLDKNIKSIDFDYLFTSTFFGSALPQFRILVNRNDNCKIINRFHGGGYTVFSNYWAENYERTNADYCFSAGHFKSKSNNKNYHYLPPPIINKKNKNLFFYWP